MDQGESSRRVPGLVTLQATDQVPRDRNPGGSILFRHCFLHPILAHVVEPCLDRHADGLDTMRLRDGNDPDRMVPATSTSTGLDDISHPGQAVAKGRFGHKQEI
jgi:hypothetical protein